MIMIQLILKDHIIISLKTVKMKCRDIASKKTIRSSIRIKDIKKLKIRRQIEILENIEKYKINK